MWSSCVLAVLAALAALAAGHQPSSAEWMPGVVSRRAAGPPPAPLPPRDPDAEIIRPITDPRPALDGNFQVPHGHRLAGVYRNDKPSLPEDYVRYLQQQGLTPEQIEHGAGLEGTRRVRAPAAGSGPTPAAVPAPAPGQLPLPGGLTLHLEPNEPEQRPEQRPPRPPLPADLYPAVQTVPSPSIDHLRSAADRAARHNEVGVTATAAGGPTPAWPDFPKLSELRRGRPGLEDLRRHHRRIRQRLDKQWERHLQQHQETVRGRHGLQQSGGGAPQVREEYHVRHLPGGGRSVSYSKRTSHSTSYTTRGGQSGTRQSQQLLRRKRQHQPLRLRRQWAHHW